MMITMTIMAMTIITTTTTMARVTMIITIM
jgi:hypothetical protein